MTASRVRLGLVMMLALDGCALFPSLDGLDGSTNDDGGGVDAVNDVVIVSDGSDASPVDSAPWCATHVAADAADTVCFDFDEPDAGTTTHDINCDDDASPCTPTIETAPDTDSPPNARIVEVPKLDPYPAYVTARDTLAWTHSFQTATIAFDLRVEATTASGILGVFEWGTVNYQLALNATTFTFRAQSYDPDAGDPEETYTPSGPPIDFTKWHRFEITVSGSKKTVAVSVDGMAVIGDTTRSLAVYGYITFDWGVNYINGPITPIKYHYDNIVLSTTNP